MKRFLGKAAIRVFTAFTQPLQFDAPPVVLPSSFG
uniref:Uncharacterized protein n=1 Tax=Arundo donax TaxID=35708 RepID=A0A0A9QBG1_ARUDO